MITLAIYHIQMNSDIVISDSSKKIVDNMTKLIKDLLQLKTDLLLERNQDTETHQKQLYVLNEILKKYSQEKKDVLNETIEFVPLTTQYKKQVNHTNNNIKTNFQSVAQANFYNNNKNTNTRTTNAKSNQAKESSDEAENTESSYEFSDVDEEETKTVDKFMALALQKLERSRQTKEHIHITTTY